MMDALKMSYGFPTYSVVFSEVPLKWYSTRIWVTWFTDILQVQISIEAHFVSDVLRGNDTTEMRVTLLRYIEDEMPPEDD